MIELIKEANNEYGKAKVTTITNKVLPQQLHGYQLLFVGLSLIADAKAANKICDFLAHLYVNINETLVQKAITTLSQTFLKNIKEALNSSNKIYLGRLLVLMKKTLDFDD